MVLPHRRRDTDDDGCHGVRCGTHSRTGGSLRVRDARVAAGNAKWGAMGAQETDEAGFDARRGVVDGAQLVSAATGIASLSLVFFPPKEWPEGWPALLETWREPLLAVLGVLLLFPALRRLYRRFRRWRNARRAVKSYLASVREELLDELPALPSSVNHMNLSDALRDRSCYMDPPFRGSKITRLAHEGVSLDDAGTLVQQVLASVLAGDSVLLTGDPGTGKSLAAFLCFAELADKHLKWRSRTSLPILIRLNSMRPSSGEASVSGKLKDLIPPDLLSRWSPDGFEKYQEKRGVVLILDGLDELPNANGSRVERFHLPAELDHLTQHTCILTCRTQFFQIHFESFSFFKRFDTQYSILPLDFEKQVVPYVRRYCSASGSPQLGQTVTEIIAENRALREVCTRALMLRMTASVLVEECRREPEAAPRRFMFTGSDTVNAEVYETYIGTWLKREHNADAPGLAPPVLTIDEKRELTQVVAFEIFRESANAGTAFSNFELSDLLIRKETLIGLIEAWLTPYSQAGNHSRGVGEVLDDLEQRTFLLVNHRSHEYRFVHKSFYEYMLARYSIQQLSSKTTQPGLVLDILENPFPDEVIDFIRELLQWSRRSWNQDAASNLRGNDAFYDFKPGRIARSLASVIPLEEGEGGVITPAKLMAIQQAANLLPIVAEKALLDQLAVLVGSGVHPFVRRGIAVGIALQYDDESYLDGLVDEWDADLNARAFHMGYNRIYYGDQANSAGSYLDDGAPECEHFYAACLRHLTVPRYRAIRYMALASLQYFVEDPWRLHYLQSKFTSLLDDTLVAMERLELAHESERYRLRIQRILNALGASPLQPPLVGLEQE